MHLPHTHTIGPCTLPSGLLCSDNSSPYALQKLIVCKSPYKHEIQLGTHLFCCNTIKSPSYCDIHSSYRFSHNSVCRFSVIQNTSPSIPTSLRVSFLPSFLLPLTVLQILCNFQCAPIIFHSILFNIP